MILPNPRQIFHPDLIWDYRINFVVHLIEENIFIATCGVNCIRSIKEF